MARLIDADALKDCFCKGPPELIYTHVVLGMIDDAPTVDAKPVRHGRWTDGEDQYWLRATCSVCGSHPWRGFIPSAEMLKTSNKYNYCPTCGAKMDGGENDGKAD